jgi:hypothetical protein
VPILPDADQIAEVDEPVPVSIGRREREELHLVGMRILIGSVGAPGRRCSMMRAVQCHGAADRAFTQLGNLRRWRMTRIHAHELGGLRA